MDYVVVHYAEIGLKGKNRAVFERKLMSNIKTALRSFSYSSVSRRYGRLLVKLEKDSDLGEIEKILKNIAGIAHFSFARSCSHNIKPMEKILVEIAKGEKPESFAISSRRSYKAFPFTSLELNKKLGKLLGDEFGWKVKLTNPELTFYVDVTEKEVLIYTSKIKGLGGLPVTSSGKVVSLISGGIDSPVASYRIFKRGCSVVFVHFHNITKQSDVVRDKVERLVKILEKYQPSTKLYMIPFGKIQKELIKAVPSKYRMIIYRRVMFMIANEIARKEKALGFVTGDSIGQVASQTLENLNVIYESAELPVYAPLISMDKQEIVDSAKEIGTYEISILPYSDCCSFLVAQHPETRANLKTIKEIEEKINLDELVNEAIKEAELFKKL